MRRAIVLVMDGCGAGEAPDAAEFGDDDHPSTIRHVWDFVGSIAAPNLRSSGFFAACGVENEQPVDALPNGLASGWGRLRELSKGGKDSVTGHWEMAGIVTSRPFPTYPNGFPAEVIESYEAAIGRKVIGNKPASGTEIIAQLGSEHLRTGYPIVYTSADSVFQIACHERIVSAEQLYGFCEAARGLLVEPNNVQRVIARPFVGEDATGFKRTEHRKDFPLPPPPNLCDQIGDVYGLGVVPELFGGRGFRKVQRTQNNAEHYRALLAALQSDARFIWANFEDFDMLYGHRNDPAGFAKCLETFDGQLGELMSLLSGDDLLLLTADHGNDPTTLSTDHSREYVPVVCVASGERFGQVGDIDGMTAVGATVARHLGVEWGVGVPIPLGG